MGEKKRKGKDMYISEIFKELLDVFNKIIVGLSIVSKNNNIYTVSNNDFIGELTMVIYQYSKTKPIELERNIVNAPFRKKNNEDNNRTLNYDQYISAVQTLVEKDEGNYYRIHEKFRESERLFFSERYNDCIVTRNTAFEMFATNIVIRYEKLEKNASEKRLYNLSNKTGFANIISENLSKIITDKLQLRDADLIDAMNKQFLATCSQYRHSIVHRGESFSGKEAVESMELLDDIVLLLIDNIHQIEGNSFANEFKDNNVVTQPSMVQKTIAKHSKLIG